MFKKLLDFINQPTKFGEIIRFVITGGIATVVDFIIMAVTLYAFNKQIYPHFYNVFFGAKTEPSAVSTLIGTGLGFTIGLIVNYLMSVLFVFNEKGKSKTITGFLAFAILSFIGLLIHELGMWLMFDKLGVNEWLVKIFLTLVVLVYNYITRKLFIFRKKGDDVI